MGEKSAKAHEIGGSLPQVIPDRLSQKRTDGDAPGRGSCKADPPQPTFKAQLNRWAFFNSAAEAKAERGLPPATSPQNTALNRLRDVELAGTYLSEVHFMRGMGLHMGLSRYNRFNPAALFGSSTAGAYYEISPSTTFTDTARTTPAQVDQAVAAVTDQSGRGNHLTQATAASRPILRQDSGGYYYLEFDGVDDFLSSANNGAATTWTALAAIRQTAADGFADVWNDKNGNAGLRLGSTDNTGASALVGNGAAFMTSSSAGAMTANVIAGAKYDGTNATAYRNGTAGTPAAVVLSAGAAGWTLGKSHDFAGNYFTGRIYSLVSIHRILSDAETVLARQSIARSAGIIL